MDYAINNVARKINEFGLCQSLYNLINMNLSLIPGKTQICDAILNQGNRTYPEQTDLERVY